MAVQGMINESIHSGLAITDIFSQIAYIIINLTFYIVDITLMRNLASGMAKIVKMTVDIGKKYTKSGLVSPEAYHKDLKRKDKRTYFLCACQIMGTALSCLLMFLFSTNALDDNGLLTTLVQVEIAIASCLAVPGLLLILMPLSSLGLESGVGICMNFIKESFRQWQTLFYTEAREDKLKVAREDNRVVPLVINDDDKNGTPGNIQLECLGMSCGVFIYCCS